MILWNNIALIEDDRYFTRWVKETGRLDHHQGFLRAILPHLRGTVLDVGANIGTHTHFYLSHADYVHAFEPSPEAFECLAHNCPGAILHNVAVGSAPGHVSMGVAEHGNYGANYTVPSSSPAIPVITIDSLNLPACDFIKIDVEGDEIEVLLGATATITKYRPVLCIECNEHTLIRKGLTGNDLVAHLNLLGYTHSIRKPEDISCDLICLPAPTQPPQAPPRE
jgi:FkbM family methyltransferase